MGMSMDEDERGRGPGDEHEGDGLVGEYERWGRGLVGLAVVGLALLSGCRDAGEDDDGDDSTGETGDQPGDPTGEDPTDDPTDETGGVPDNGLPIELELARFNATGKWLLLRFSEPVGPVDAVDPSDFRISMAVSVRYAYADQVMAQSNYWDPNYYLATGYSYLPVEIDFVAAGNMPTDIVLRLTNPITAETCASVTEFEAYLAEVDGLPEYQAKGGLFPHYSPGAVPVVSADGDVLAPIGADWVEWEGPAMYTEIWGWPDLDPEIPIPCDVAAEP